MSLKIEDIKGYVIHLSHRSDRREILEREIPKLGIRYEIQEGVKTPNNGYVGVSMGFREIIKKAKSQKLEQVWIFEDDLHVLHEDSKLKLQQSIDDLPEDWDMLLGGIYGSYEYDIMDNMISDNLMKLTDFSAMHCCLIRDTMYDVILNHTPEKGGTRHIDRYVSEKIRKDGLNVYVSIPYPVMQYDGFSDNVGCQTVHNRRVNDKTIFKGFK
jgi:hypothetical protein